MLLLALAISLQVEAYPVGRTVNTENTIVYWVVEFSGTDCQGNIHRRREEVNTYGEADRLGVITIANKQLLKKLREGEETVVGFLKALEATCERLNTLQ